MKIREIAKAEEIAPFDPHDPLYILNDILPVYNFTACEIWDSSSGEMNTIVNGRQI